MIERLIEYSIRNRFLVLAGAFVLAVAAVYAVLQTPVDAIPDLSENQVIVFADWMGRSPREIEDQVTYPLSRKLQGLAGVKAVRSSSEFNFSMITIIFDDRVDYYFARQRVSEKLSQSAEFLPPGVTPYLAPDATALGQVFWYTVEVEAEQPLSPGRLWALNKFYIAPQLNAAEGVAEVAVVGGAPQEYQIDVRPDRLQNYGVTLGELEAAIRKSNLPAGGGVIQKNNAEYIVRGVGWIQSKQDIENTLIKQSGGTPICIKHVAVVQLGVQFRRGVFEKGGSEVTGGVVLMRHGQNPLAVTNRVKHKIEELQSGLPPGVRIVAAYDRTRLVRGAIHTLTEVMTHEMLIASLAILLILMHVRSVLVICVTLPLSVLFSFLMMYLLRVCQVIDIQANIMSLAGITISIGILVDQAIVMTENASHHLVQHFGRNPVRGDIRSLVIGPCRTVGRPIFFSVLIMLLSFVPVFMLSGREGKLFLPLAFTKSFAMIGVAIISVTVVPALIPTFLKGRLRSEDENPIVRSFIQIYRPLLTWALPRWNLVIWFFSALLLVAAGAFPLQALLGMGAQTTMPRSKGEWRSLSAWIDDLVAFLRGAAPAETAWKICFLAVFLLVVPLTVHYTIRWYWKLVSLGSLLFVAVWAYQIEPKIGVTFMPALDEGTTLDMPVTVPRASVTQAADDLKARDALIRGFPEVESVIGKAGRADTPTDPAPLDMVETFVNYRPKEFWPKRVLRYADAAAQTTRVLDRLLADGYLVAPDREGRTALIVDASQKALERFDETLRELAKTRFHELEQSLERKTTRFVLGRLTKRLIERGAIAADHPAVSAESLDGLTEGFAPRYGPWLARAPAVQDVAQLCGEFAARLHRDGALPEPAAALHLAPTLWEKLRDGAGEVLGQEQVTLFGQMHADLLVFRERSWREALPPINGELFDRGCEAYTWLALEEILAAGQAAGLLDHAAKGEQSARFVEGAVKARLGQDRATGDFAAFQTLRGELEKPFRTAVFFWPRQSGPKGDLVDDEMGRVLQVPGWSNIFTQPIINRIEMLSTGVRTDIGVKVFGDDLEAINRVCQEIETALKPVPGARDVVAAPILGKGYLQIDIDRQAAARYGVTVEDVQNEIELALGGRAVTYTVEKRERFPVRLRYARADRRDEERIRRLLVSPAGLSGSSMSGGLPSPAAAPPGSSGASMYAAGSADNSPAFPGHASSPAHAGSARGQAPLSAVASIRVVEGPAMIKSENGRLLNYVTLNVRGRDLVSFVDEAQRVIAQKVRLPDGMHLEWSGEFEHQVQAARTLRLVFPLVLALIFLILYLTYHDLADAGLMMLAVPEALAGGAFFMILFPKFTQGWNAPPVDFSVAVWVGFIACFGMATETGIIMLVYLREAIDKRGGLEKIGSLAELREAVIEGAVHRLRPKLLTEGVAILAVFPMLFARGVGGEVLSPMALPVLGGLLISDEVVDLFLPVRFYWVRRARWLALHQERMGTNPSS